MSYVTVHSKAHENYSLRTQKNGFAKKWQLIAQKLDMHTFLSNLHNVFIVTYHW